MDRDLSARDVMAAASDSSAEQPRYFDVAVARWESFTGPKACSRNGLYGYEKWVLGDVVGPSSLTGGSTLATSHPLFTGQEFPAHDLDFRRSFDANAKHATCGFENLDFYVLADPEGLARASHDHQQVDGSRRSATYNAGHRAPLLLPRGEIRAMWLVCLREKNVEGIVRHSKTLYASRHSPTDRRSSPMWRWRGVRRSAGRTRGERSRPGSGECCKA